MVSFGGRSCCLIQVIVVHGSWQVCLETFLNKLGNFGALINGFLIHSLTFTLKDNKTLLWDGSLSHEYIS